jgi:hypothetical protein
VFCEQLPSLGLIWLVPIERSGEIGSGNRHLVLGGKLVKMGNLGSSLPDYDCKY